MSDTSNSPPLPLANHRLRSGTAARLAGLPVTTLRVWERRYGVASASKSQSGQRVYSSQDVSRLRLLRQLTQAGHAIGSIATLELQALHALANGLPDTPSTEGLQLLSAVVVGRSAAQACESVPGVSIAAVHDDIDVAEAAAKPDGPVELLLVRVASLQPDTVERVLSLGAALGAVAICVVYAFGTKSSAGALRDAGAVVHREPLAARTLVQWVRDVRQLPASPRQTAGAGWTVAPRRFSDTALANLTQMRSSVACECLRHMAEIVGQLAGFERYSADCTSSSSEDAVLHKQLSRTAGAARTMFEQVLQRVVDEHDLEIRDEPDR